MIKINLHKLIGIEINNPQIYVKKFLKEEFFSFVQNDEVKRNIILDFKKKIIIPSQAKKLKNNFFYDSDNKVFYFKKDKKTLSYDISSYFENKIYVKIEQNFNIWYILYIIENTIYFLLSKKNFCMLHAGAVRKKNNSILILGPQGSGKTLFTLNKLKEGYSFLGDEYVFINKNAECLSFPRALNFKKFHKNHYKIAFKYKWSSLNISEKLIWIVKQLVKTILLRPDWKPMVRLRLGRIYPKVQIVPKTKINKIIVNFKNKEKLIRNDLMNLYTKAILENIQSEMKWRFFSIYKSFFVPKDVFLKKVISDINRLEKNKLKIIKNFMRKSF